MTAEKGAPVTCECNDVYPCPAEPVPGQPMCRYCAAGHDPRPEALWKPDSGATS